MVLRFLLGGSVFLAGCSDATRPTVAGPVAAMDILAGQNQEGVVDKELPAVLEVRVTDAAGNPVAGQVVNFRVTAGGGTAFAGSAATTSAGIVKERWTLGIVAADSQRLDVRAVDPVSGDAKVYATFVASAKPDAPASIVKLAGDAQTAAAGTVAPDSLSVRVVDKYSNPVPGVTVTWIAASGSGSVSPASSTTAAQGLARTQWTAAAAVAPSQQVTASAGSLSASFLEAGVAGPPTQLLTVQSAAGAAANAAFATQPKLRIADANGIRFRVRHSS